MAFLIVAHPSRFGSSERLGPRPLKERTIQRHASFDMKTHGGPIQLAIAFETNEHLTPQFLASVQKLGCCIPPICHNDDGSLHQRDHCPQLLYGNPDSRLLSRDAPLIEKPYPTTRFLRQEHHSGKLPSHTDWLDGTGQIRDMNDAAIWAGFGFGS